METKKQIWVVWNTDQWGKFISPAMITTSIMKVKRFLIKEINNDNAIYRSNIHSKKIQINLFKEDFKKEERRFINSNLTYFQYEYYYDGEEI